MFLPAGDRGVVGAVFPEVPGERPPGPGSGGREAGPQAVSEGEPGAQCTQPGADMHTHTQSTASRFLLDSSLISFSGSRLGAEQPSGCRDHQDALHDV